VQCTSIWFKESSLALAMGFTSAAGRLAEIITFNSMATIAENYDDYRIALWYAFMVSSSSVFFGMVACGLDLWGEKQNKKDGVIRFKDTSVGSLVTLDTVKAFPRSYWFMSCTLMFFYCTIFPFLSYASDFLQLKFHYEEVYAGRVVSILSLVSMMMAPTLGFILDRVGKRIYAVMFGSSLMIPACLILGMTDTAPVIPMMLVGVAYSCVPAALWPSLACIIPDHAFSTAFGITASMANVALIPTYYFVGFFVDESHQVAESLVMLACTGGMSLVFAILWHIEDTKTGAPCNRSAYATYLLIQKQKGEEIRDIVKD